MGEYRAAAGHGGEINVQNTKAHLSLRITFKLTHSYRSDMLKKLTEDMNHKKSQVGSQVSLSYVDQWCSLGYREADQRRYLALLYTSLRRRVRILQLGSRTLAAERPQ